MQICVKRCSFGQLGLAWYEGKGLLLAQQPQLKVDSFCRFYYCRFGFKGWMGKIPPGVALNPLEVFPGH